VVQHYHYLFLPLNIPASWRHWGELAVVGVVLSNQLNLTTTSKDLGLEAKPAAWAGAIVQMPDAYISDVLEKEGEAPDKMVLLVAACSGCRSSLR
jgi:hypothetical protein